MHIFRHVQQLVTSDLVLNVKFSIQQPKFEQNQGTSLVYITEN